MGKTYFVHIGKCSGTTICSLYDLQVCHLTKPSPRPGQNILIWIRNPFSRMVSAFNYQKAIVNFDVDELTIEEIKARSLAPFHLLRKKKTGSKYVFSEEFDSLMNCFDCHNHLFEALSSSDVNEQTKARRLLSLPVEHFHKGISWYLDGGEFVKRHYRKIIFVGRTESIDEDVLAYSKKLGLSQRLVPKKRSSQQAAKIYLSKTSADNLAELFERSEFKTLEVLRDHGFLQQETYVDYQTPCKDYTC